ncbi:MAG: hypothetical protein ABMA25_02735 [Ilumatobacteraceae bacterium]
MSGRTVMMSSKRAGLLAAPIVVLLASCSGSASPAATQPVPTTTVAVTAAPTTTLAATTTTAAPPCEGAAASLSAFPTIAEVRELFQSLSANDVASADDVLGALDEITALPPRFNALLNRATFGDPAVADMIAAVDAVNEECGELIIDTTALSSTGPVLAANGVATLTDFDGNSCDAGNPYSATMVGLYCDVDGTNVDYLLNPATGAMVPTQPAWGDDWFVVADRVLWWTTEEVPASGLTPAGRRFTLSSDSWLGGDAQVLTTLNGTDDSYTMFSAAGRDNFVGLEMLDGTDRLVLRDLTGQEVFGVEHEGVSDVHRLFDTIVNVGSQTVDLERLVLLDKAYRPGATDECAARTAIEPGFFDEGTTVVLSMGPDGLTSVTTAINQRGFPLGDGVFGSDFSSFDLVYYGPDGAERWRIANDIALSYTVFGDQLVIQNAADELVAVDTATGTEATLDPSREQALRNIMINSDWVAIDHLTGLVVSEIDSAGSLHITTVEACAVEA